MELSNAVKGIIVAFLYLMFGLALGNPIVAQVQDLNTTSWVFVGYEAVISMIGLFPLIYYGGVIVGFLAIIWASTTQTG